MRQPYSDAPFQILRPPPNGCRRPLRGGTKEMHMIGHNDVPSHMPGIRITTSLDIHGVKIGGREEISAWLHSECNKQQHGAVRLLDRGLMRGPFALRPKAKLACMHPCSSPTRWGTARGDARPPGCSGDHPQALFPPASAARGDASWRASVRASLNKQESSRQRWLSLIAPLNSGS